MKYPGSLHNHTDYSNLRLRDCINRVTDLIDYAVELGHNCVAITDHESLSSHIKVEEYAKKIREKNPDFKVIRGNEIYLVRNGLNASNYDSSIDKYFHFILLAKDAIGHKQLREISSRAWRRSYMARGLRRVPTYYQDLIDIIGANPGHVIASTACMGGFLPTQLMRNGGTTYSINLWCEKMVKLFGEGNFYLEMQPSKNKDQIFINKELLSLSKELNIPYIITTDSHYLKKEDAPIHKAYLNSEDGDREVDSFYATTYMMSDNEIREYFKYFTEEEIEKGFSSIQSIANKCEDYSLFKPLKIPQLPWKDYSFVNIKEEYMKAIPMFSDFLKSDYEGDRVLVKAIAAKLDEDERLRNKKTYDEINSCLSMTKESSEVNKAHWSAYYLNLQRIIDECWAAGTLVGPGRGSGVGFILLYLLGITQINPQWETTPTFSWRLTRKESKAS